VGVLGYEPLPSQIDDAPPKAGRARAIVAAVEPGGLAERAGLAPGDAIESINGEPIEDVIDLMFHAAEDVVSIVWRAGGDGPTRRKRLKRRANEELGLALEDFRIRLCNNQCVFCFIHQNPKGMRRGVYFKDGDYRMSFLHGNYVTTTNMTDADFERIIEQRLSPMYVSVHATNHELRLKMLGAKSAPDIVETLKRLARGRIEFHTQIVLCPGWNDGAELDRTIDDLLPLRPHLLSIAVVPLGLTEHRRGLPKMTPVTPTSCRRTIDRIEPRQAKLRADCGEPIVYLADEFYVTAGRATPDYEGIDILHQLENGVGMVWEFMRGWKQAERALPRRLDSPRRVAILTGLLGARVLRPIARRLNAIENLTVDLIPIENSLFGRAITVSGLLPGRDFQRAIAENPGCDRYLIPGNAIRAEGEVFLDDMTLENLRAISSGRAFALEGDCEDLIEASVNGAPHASLHPASSEAVRAT
jgi:putative radical SAM enzyme (TIGR03279 family)